MTITQSIARPPRCSIANVTTGESIECLFNPTQLTEKVKINWNRLAVPGLSHQVLQYQSTGNRQVTGVEFYVDKFFATKQPGNSDILRFRSFLRALSVPPAEMLAPSRALIIWPKVLASRARLARAQSWTFIRWALKSTSCTVAPVSGRVTPTALRTAASRTWPA